MKPFRVLALAATLLAVASAAAQIASQSFDPSVADTWPYNDLGTTTANSVFVETASLPGLATMPTQGTAFFGIQDVADGTVNLGPRPTGGAPDVQLTFSWEVTGLDAGEYLGYIATFNGVAQNVTLVSGAVGGVAAAGSELIFAPPGTTVAELTFTFHAPGVTSRIGLDDVVLASGAPLPVTLVDFAAEPVPGGGVAVAWTTAAERDHAYFALERSSDGERFTEVTRVLSRGDGEAARDYGYVDVYAPAGEVYYRLRSVGHDGATELSELVSVQAESGRGNLAVWASGADVWTVSTTGPTRLAVVDAAGRVALRWRVDAAGRHEISTAQLPAGAYVVTDGRDAQRAFR